MKDAMKKSKDASGIMSLNKNLVKDVDDTVKKWIDSAKKQGQDIDKMGEQELKYLVELNKPKVKQRTLTDMIEKLGLNDPKKNKFLQKKGEVVDLTGKTIHPGEKIMGGEGITGGIEGIKNKMSGIQKLSDELGKMSKGYDSYYGLKKSQDVVTDTVTKIKTMEPVAAMEEANSVIGRKGKYKNLTKDESQKILKDTEDWIFQRDPDDLYDYNKKRPFRDDPDVDPEDFADGGIAGMLGEGPDKYSPKNFYALGIGPVLQDYLLGERPVDEEGFHTTLNKKDLKNLLNLLKEEGGFEDIKDELMFRLGRVNPEKKHSFHLGLGKDKAEIGFKKQFAGGGIAGMLGEPTYADENHRVPYKDGTKFNPKRRTILKGLGALAALPVVGKFFKFAKPLAKTSKVADLTSVPIGSADGMPVWFKPLVNKVIKEGTEVPSGAERVIVHKTKLPNSKTDVYVEQKLDTGDVTVDIGLEKHGFPDGKFGQPVRLEYKASEVIEPTINTKTGKVYDKGGKTKEEFWVEEAEFTGGHPENIKFEESTFNKFGQHESNFDEVEAFAKGKTKKTRDISSLQKQNEDLADHFSNYPDPDDFASGGRVSRSGGGIMKILKLFKTKPETLKEFIDRRNFLKLMIGNTDNMKNKRMLEEILEENKKVKGFEFPESGIGSDIHKEIETILNKDVTKHATGGRVPMLFGGGVWKKIIQNLAKERGVNPSTYLKITNYKALPNDVKKYITPEDYRKMKEGRIEMFENWVEMAKSKKSFQKSIEEGKKGSPHAAPIFEHLEKSFKSVVPSGVTDKDILQGEYILKNLKTKDRKLNASGGLAGMLGE